ncbi:hypothetical protein Misp04_33110 [Micromonospora sp. NBRC 101691]|nr:hypothetical protein Misp04_33110 [Micromonospora sp. NBRC 101691]
MVPTAAVGLVEQLRETLGTPTGEEVAVHRRHLLSLVTVVRPFWSPVGRPVLGGAKDRRGRLVDDGCAVPAAGDGGGNRWDAGRRESWRGMVARAAGLGAFRANTGCTRRNGRCRAVVTGRECRE